MIVTLSIQKTRTWVPGWSAINETSTAVAHHKGTLLSGVSVSWIGKGEEGALDYVKRHALRRIARMETVPNKVEFKYE